MRSKPMLDERDVSCIVDACIAEARKNGWSVSIAVVDDAGHVLRLQRLDGAPLQTPDVALAKARTAALLRISTAQLEQAVRERPTLAQVPGRLPVEGGVPIFYDAACIGGVGVSGVESQHDAEIALAGARALGAQAT